MLTEGLFKMWPFLHYATKAVFSGAADLGKIVKSSVKKLLVEFTTSVAC